MPGEVIRHLFFSSEVSIPILKKNVSYFALAIALLL